VRTERRLVLKRETLTELTDDELTAVAGGQATIGNVCGTGITVLVHGCPSDPRICEYTNLC
jgi:hypothetical protein